MKVQFKSNHAKYSTRNPISKALVLNFFKETKAILSRVEYGTILDVGCGEGHLLNYLCRTGMNKKFYAIDLDEKEIEAAKVNCPFGEFFIGSILKLPFPDDFADLVICTEVLEHVENPEAAVNELYRVTSHYALLSVPNEPLWRALNIMRFHYLKDLGNTPGHVNHWSSISFANQLSVKFNILKISKPIPWTLVLCEKKSM
jgi:2-polyprenyl-3-methyl-5-hydroxy-6-metoxy-1,4-benzoquinol methylase